MAQTIRIDGERALKRTLDTIVKDGTPRIQRASLTGAMVPLKKQIRMQITGTSISPRLKRAAKATVGSSVKRKRGIYTAKAGLGVGKPTKAKSAKASARAGSGRGVGISANNIHWVVFGTGVGSTLAGSSFMTDTGKVTSRATGRGRQTKSGKSTGSTPPYLLGLVSRAAMISSPAMVQESAKRASKALIKEAHKAKRR